MKFSTAYDCGRVVGIIEDDTAIQFISRVEAEVGTIRYEGLASQHHSGVWAATLSAIDENNPQRQHIEQRLFESDKEAIAAANRWVCKTKKLIGEREAGAE